jgi:heme/copper-type cytochrome/quinol oxidase subunit 2
MGLFDKVNRAFLEYEQERNIRKGKEKFDTLSSDKKNSSPTINKTFIIIIIIVLILAIVCMFVITYSFLVCMRCNAGNDKNDNTSLIEILLLTIMIILLPGLFHIVYIIYKKSDCNPKKRKELEKLI